MGEGGQGDRAASGLGQGDGAGGCGLPAARRTRGLRRHVAEPPQHVGPMQGGAHLNVSGSSMGAGVPCSVWN